MVIVTFQGPEGARAVEVPQGTTLLAAARSHGFRIDAPCGGAGTCGKCRVRLDDPSRVRVQGRHRLGAQEEALGWVLACEAEVMGPVSVEIPEHRQAGLQILNEGHSAEFALAPWITKAWDPVTQRTRVLAGGQLWLVEPGNTVDATHGLVVDIGTTTLVASLVDLASGEELALDSALNPQAVHAQDVLSRIQLASTPEGLALLQGELIQELNRLVAKLTAAVSVPRASVYEAVFSGNTAMLHLAVGVDPRSLGEYPYTFDLPGDQHFRAMDLGLELHPEAMVYLPPNLSAYVGADITSGLLATRLEEAEGVHLFVDIGTNGEMVLAVDGRMTATSTAAGPAFEGMNIVCGMRAAAGAVEAFSLVGEEIHIKTIGDVEPLGICGSGLVDLVGELASQGVISSSGRFARTHDLSVLDDRIADENGKIRFQLAGPVYLTQKDVRQVQLAKAAIRAGIDLLLQSEGLGPADVDRVLIAGSFGYHLRARSLVNLGLLPAEFLDRVLFVGNTSKTGGRAFLLDSAQRSSMAALARQVSILELANQPEFEKAFVAAMAFPEAIPTIRDPAHPSLCSS